MQLWDIGVTYVLSSDAVARRMFIRPPRRPRCSLLTVVFFLLLTTLIFQVVKYFSQARLETADSAAVATGHRQPRLLNVRVAATAASAPAQPASTAIATTHNQPSSASLQTALKAQLSGFHLVKQLQPRRNHGCAFTRDGQEMVLVGGRLAPGIEVWDVSNASSRLVASNHSLLDVHHHVLLGVDKVEGGGEELWVVCGFSQMANGHETQRNNTLVVDTSTWEVREGPRTDEPRGACGALALHLDGPQAPAHICLFGGSVGPHDRGTFTSSVSCLDRATGRWARPLPQLPMPADHLNVVLLPGGDPCSQEGGALPQRVLLMNYRDRPYGEPYTEVWALDLVAGEGGRPTPGPAWYLFANSTTSAPRDAAGIVLSPSGRFVLSFGGVTYAGETSPWHRPSTHVFSHHEIRALDVCSREWVPAGRLHHPRFAVVTCATPAGAAISCGGTAVADPWWGMTNIQDCEAQDIAQLELAALAAVAGAGAQQA